MTSVETFRSLYNGCGILLLGTLFFLLLIAPGGPPAIVRWRERALPASALLALACVAGATAMLLDKAAELNGAGAALLDLSGWQKILATRFGQVWSGRAVAGLVVAGVLLACRVGAVKRALVRVPVIACMLAAAGLAVGPLAGHGAGLDPSWPGIGIHAVHLLAAGAWLGGLPALAALMWWGAREGGAEPGGFAGRSLARFSTWAVVMVVLVAASGIPLAYMLVNGVPAGVPAGAVAQTFPALVGTAYGRVILAKISMLLLILALAGHVRWHLLPRVAHGNGTRADTHRIGQWVAWEGLLGLAVVVLGSVAAETTPAAHEQIVWPFAYRLSLDATWSDPTVRAQVSIGTALAVAGILWGAVAWARARSAGRRARPAAWQRWGAAAAIAIGLGCALPPIAVEAYPDTYRRPAVVYEAASIASGASLFLTHCTSCHGAGGRGDGPLAGNLPTRPANLTEPHTALHTGGDMFWWLTHGMRGKAMPGFAATLPEDERWDVINFLRALSIGYQARIIDDRVVPEKPWLGAPDFSFSTSKNANSRLKDYRYRKSVLLVFYTLPHSQARLERLRDEADRLSTLGVEIVAVPVDQPGALAEENATAAPLPFSIGSAGSSDVVVTYALMARSFAESGNDVNGPRYPHLEFLIDRFGYLRARWIGRADLSWSNRLDLQIEQLNRERQLLAPPDDHVH